MEKIKCKNCGKTKGHHYKSVEDKYGGEWCYKLSKVKPSDDKYYMRYSE